MVLSLLSKLEVEAVESGTESKTSCQGLTSLEGKMARFSKTALVSYLQAKIGRLQGEYGFNTGDGYHQVERREPAVQRAYGEFDALITLLDAVESGYVSEEPVRSAS
jgi:hypothetical protein